MQENLREKKLIKLLLPTDINFSAIKTSINQIKLYIYTAPIKVRLLTGASYKYARSNKTVFNNRLNCSREVSSLFRLSGRLFHTSTILIFFAAR